jgi:hypothetical protein
LILLSRLTSNDLCHVLSAGFPKGFTPEKAERMRRTQQIELEEKEEDKGETKTG